jgi:hypothetical protein
MAKPKSSTKELNADKAVHERAGLDWRNSETQQHTAIGQ